MLPCVFWLVYVVAIWVVIFLSEYFFFHIQTILYCGVVWIYFSSYCILFFVFIICMCIILSLIIWIILESFFIEEYDTFPFNSFFFPYIFCTKGCVTFHVNHSSAQLNSKAYSTSLCIPPMSTLHTTHVHSSSFVMLKSMAFFTHGLVIVQTMWGWWGVYSGLINCGTKYVHTIFVCIKKIINSEDTVKSIISCVVPLIFISLFSALVLNRIKLPVPALRSFLRIQYGY